MSPSILPGGEPVVVVRGQDEQLRGFFNVCRHHAAAVVTDAEGSARQFRCPYHGWTYALNGELKGTPDFTGVCDFDRSANGLVPLDCAANATWAFVKADAGGLSLEQFLGPDLVRQLDTLGLARLHWMERRSYTLDCNWKVFVDNYLDGGYHVPHLHKGLDSVLEYSEYTIANGERYCLQSSPLVKEGADERTKAARHGERAYYYWIHPNFMVNCYGQAMDTNLVIPRGVDRTEVIFDFYFADISGSTRAANLESIAVSEQIQQEDVAICESVQRGLKSRAYGGRPSVGAARSRRAPLSSSARARSQASMTGLSHSRSRGRLLPILGIGFGLAVPWEMPSAPGSCGRPARSPATCLSSGCTWPPGSSAVCMRCSAPCSSPSSAR
jgi:choline monooxygenase